MKQNKLRRPMKSYQKKMPNPQVPVLWTTLDINWYNVFIYILFGAEQ